MMHIRTTNRTMQRTNTFLFLSFTTLLFTACRKEDIRSTGVISTEVRSVPTFTDVRIEGPINAEIRYGLTQEVMVRTDVSALSKMRTTVSNNTLILSLDQANYGNGLRFEATVYMPTIGRLTQNGVSDTRLSGFFGLQTLEVISNGVGDLDLHGSADRLLITQHGVGRLDAQGMNVDTCQVGLSGVGSVEVRVNELLHGYLSGVGSIYYHGTPQVNINDTGVGNVIRVD